MNKLKSMKLTKADEQAREAQYSSPTTDAPRYPWGVSMQLDEEVLDKLAVDELPAVDGELLLYARVKVTGVSSNDSSSGKRRSVSLQITEMCLEDPADAKTDAADVLFGKSKG